MEVTINYNGQAVAVEVTLEVYEFLDRADHKAENLSHEQRRHWDGREFDEYIVATEGVGIYLKEIDPGLHSLQAEVGGDIAATYPFSDPVGLVCNDEGKLIGLELNRGLRDEDGNLYDIMAGTFLVVGLSEDSFTSLTPEQVQKYTEHFKQPEQFISLNGQIIALPAEPENPLRTAEMTLEDDCVITGEIVNNGRRGEKPEKAQDEARRTMPEKNLHPGELGGC